MVIGLTAGLDACSACSSSPGGRTNCFSYFIVLSHKLMYASSDGGSLGGEIHLVNHRNPLRVRSTFTVIQCTVRGTVYYKSWPQQSFILQVELEVETLLDSILYFKRSVT